MKLLKLKMSNPLPKIIVTSVVRSSNQGESHGGVYLIDLETEYYEKVIDWNEAQIDWTGRGGDRGLRGIAIYDKNIFIAASDEIFVYDEKFELLKSIKNQYLKHCHEICIKNRKLFLTATGYDSILVYDLEIGAFEIGYTLRLKPKSKFQLILKKMLNKIIIGYKYLKCSTFDPNSNKGPYLADTCHINNVFPTHDDLLISGTKLNRALVLSNKKIKGHFNIPFGTHNVQLYQNDLIYNDTANDQVSYINLKSNTSNTFELSDIDEQNITHNEISDDHARIKFGRGLIKHEHCLISGSSPSRINVFDIKSGMLVKTVVLSNDVRNAILGIEVIELKYIKNLWLERKRLS